MIVEALQHLMTPAPRHIKKMGYVREAIAIEARYHRCKTHWQPHLEKCKAHILAQAEKLAPNSTIMILGSGGLHDVPVKELRESGHNITCVDIVHLPKVKKANKDLTFVTRDVTGLIEPLYKAVKQGVQVQVEPEWEFLKTPDLIISLNLLSQLAMKLIDYAELHGIQFSDNVLRTHVNWIKKQNTKALLISDIAREYNQGKTLLETVPALPNLDLEEPAETWLWNIAPQGEADADISITHTVGVWHL